MRKLPFNTQDILTRVESGVAVNVGRLSKDDEGYLRNWANKKGLSVSKEDNVFYVLKQKTTKTGILKSCLEHGKDPFRIEGFKSSYIRSVVSNFNQEHGTAWKVKKGVDHFIIYPSPTV